MTGQDQGRRGPGGGAGCPRAGQEGPQASPGAAAETPFSQESHVRSLRYACGPGLCWASPEASPVAQGRRETLIRFLLGRSPGGGNGNPTAWSGAQGSLADRWRPRCLCSWSERSRVRSTFDVVCTCRWAGSGSGGEGGASRQDPRAGGAAQDRGPGPRSRPPVTTGSRQVRACVELGALGVRWLPPAWPSRSPPPLRLSTGTFGKSWEGHGKEGSAPWPATTLPAHPLSSPGIPTPFPTPPATIQPQPLPRARPVPSSSC